jgi:hypothetical protein
MGPVAACGGDHPCSTTSSFQAHTRRGEWTSLAHLTTCCQMRFGGTRLRLAASSTAETTRGSGASSRKVAMG